MKKLLLMALVLLGSGFLMAQKNPTKTYSRSFLALHAGLGLPMGSLGSNNLNNENSGFAKTGYSVGLNYGYQYKKTAGVAASAFYNNFTTNSFKETFHGEGGSQIIELKMDHWKFYGLSAGPMLSYELSKNIFTDLRIMGGIANANSPKITYINIVMADEDWSWAPMLQAGINLRIGTGSNLFIFANADYMYLEPQFSYNYLDINDQIVASDIQQTISSLNVTAGVGFKF